MGRFTLALVLAAALLAAAGPAAAGSGVRHARLSLVRAEPLKVRGSGFHRHERVRVVARSPGRPERTRTVTSSRTGRIVVSFAARSVRPCGHLRVTATGDRGSRATLGGIMLPACIVD